jgi:hypothetical protein
VQVANAEPVVSVWFRVRSRTSPARCSELKRPRGQFGTSGSPGLRRRQQRYPPLVRPGDDRDSALGYGAAASRGLGLQTRRGGRDRPRHVLATALEVRKWAPLEGTVSVSDSELWLV